MTVTYRQSALYPKLKKRAHIIQLIRQFFDDKGYLEVETPIRIPAPIPEAHIEAFQSEENFLHTSPEICMKRLVAAGYSQIFQICRTFRKNERGDKHLTEFSLLEWYHTHYNYLDIMTECEALLNYIVLQTQGNHQICFKKNTINLSPPWPRMTVHEAFERYASCSLAEALGQDRFDECIAFEIEPHLGRAKPLFLCDYPVEKGALARRSALSPEIVERFELYIAGIELCNAFTELTDPVEQRQRFESELALQHSQQGRNAPMPEKFLAALQDLPPVAGNALGIDRLIMILTDSKTIDDVTAFIPEEL